MGLESAVAEAMAECVQEASDPGSMLDVDMLDRYDSFVNVESAENSLDKDMDGFSLSDAMKKYDALYGDGNIADGNDDGFENDKPEAETAEKLTEDNVGLQDKFKQMLDPNFINTLREQYPNVDKTLSKYEEILNDPDATADEKRAAHAALTKYKGSIVEAAIKEVMKEYGVVAERQHVVHTESGDTKPDVEISNVNQDMDIGTGSVKEGENLAIEVKCGRSSYIQGQFNHILNQVQGHEGKSFVMVTNDYMELSEKTRANFEEKLKEAGSGLYVIDVSGDEVMASIDESLKKEGA